MRTPNPDPRRFHALALLSGLLVVFAAGDVQAASYSPSFVPGTAFETVATDVVWERVDTGYPVDDDQQLVPIGFGFVFGGVVYTQVRVLSNGALHFGAAQGFHKDYTNEALPITTVVNGPGFEEPADRVILGYWDDLQPASGGTVRYGTLGSAPNRRFVASWQNLPHYNLPGLFSLQIVLYEDGGIRFRYGNSNTSGASATIGVEVDDGDYTQVSFNSVTVGPAQDVLFAPLPPAACGPIPATNPVYAGGTLVVDTGVSVNGNAVASGSSGPGAAITTSGAVSTFTQTLPALDPAAFPGNGSSIDADEDDSPFFATTDVYYDDIGIDRGASVSFGGGGPFHIDRLVIERDASVTLGPGLYYIDELVADRGVDINVSGTPVEVRVGSRVDIDRSTTINAAGSVAALRFVLHAGASFSLGRSAVFRGLVYGAADAGAISIGRGSSWRGAAITGGGVNVERAVQFTYTAADAAALAAISTCSTAAGVDHFRIDHAGSAVNCAAEPVTISAHLGDETLASSYTGTITLATDTGNGDWSLAGGNGTLINTGGGGASYTFDNLDGGVARLALRDTRAETVDIDVAAGSIAESPGEDPALVFAAAGFRFLAGGVVSAIGTQIAGKSSAVAPGAQIIELEAIRTDSDTGACEAALTGVVQVQMAAECRQPGTCGAAQASVNGAPIAGNSAGAVSAFTDVGLDFGGIGDGTATLVLGYADAGRLRVHARHDLPDETGAPSGDLMSGASNEYVVRPFALEMDFSGDRASLGTGGVSWAADAAGSAFVAAGTDFDISLRAVVWQAADDANADGVADGGANLADNATTTRFGAESTPPLASIAHALVAPAGGDAGTLSGAASIGGFAGGIATAALRWDEVGILDLAAVVADYLGGGAAVAGNVANVGRFHPARLAIADSGADFRDGPDVAWACGFTWMEQPFGFDGDPVFTVTAYNATGAITGNYGGDFFKLSAPFLSARAYASTATSSATLDAPALGTVSVAGDGNLDGIATLTLAGEQFAYNRGAMPEAPFAASVSLTLAAADLTDDDGVCHSSTASRCVTALGDSGEDYVVADIGGANLRFGRLAMENVSGSELLPLVMPVRSEFFDGAGFAPATDDDCSSLSLAAIDLVNDVDDPLPGVAVIGVASGVSSASIGNVPFAAGVAGLQFSAPLAGNTGHVQTRFDLPLAGMPWLRFDWDGDGAHDDEPVARASFGLRTGSPFLIHMREPWN